jgi:hypothetical protein
MKRHMSIPAPPRMKTPKKGKRNIAATYNAFKQHNGQLYTGAKVGRGQKWRYDQGEWKERKITPDKWEFTYEVTKRRAGHAPEGSGAPVGTEYHWYILAHQVVKKLNANDYSTSMTGRKYKVAHKRASKEAWSAAEKAQNKRVIMFLEETLRELKGQTPVSLPAKRANGNVRARVNANGDGDGVSQKPRRREKAAQRELPMAAAKASRATASRGVRRTH